MIAEPHSAYAAVGARLVANGYSAIPIAPGEKHPGRYTSFGWQPMGGWSKFCAELPPAFQIASWSKWPNAGVGVALGRGVVCIDIDGEYCLDAVRDALPEAKVAKKGAKGLSLFFRGNTDKIRSRSYRIDKVTAVDLLAHGRQTVLPPSIHPSTGQPYVWTTPDGLDAVAAGALSALPDNIEDILAEILTPFGFVEEPTYAADPASVSPGEDCEDGLRFYREMNEKALQHFSAWVPPLGLPKLRAAGPGKFEAVASWRPSSTGRPDNRRSPNLKFHAQGIKDMGTGETYTALNVVMRSGDMTLNQATTWLGTRLGYNFEVAIDLKPTPKPANDLVLTTEGEVLPAVLPEAPVQVVEQPMPAAAVVPFLKPESRSVETPDEKLARKLDDLTRPPGLVGDLVDWIEGSSRRPSRILALAAALAFVGTLAGRMYESPTELRTNVYLVSLAPTGYGKDHARKSIKKLAAKTNLTRFIGGERIMSASGMRTDVEQQPSIMYMLDEFGGFMKGMNDPRAGSHIKEIRDLILSLVGSAEDYYSGVSYRGGRSTVIQNPNMSIAGISTPTDFWNSMTGAGVSDGFLPRFVIMPALGARPNDREPILPSQPPEALLAAVRRLVSVKPLGGPLAGATLDASTTLTPRKLRWAGNAKDVYADMVSRCERQANAGSEAESDLWTRLPANAQKLAMIVAIGRDCYEPEIWPQDLEWAFELVSLCVRHTIEQVDGRLAENDRQREYLFVKMAVTEAGNEGLPKAVLTKKVNGRFDSKRIGMILAQLEEAGEIYSTVVQNPNGGPIQNRFFRRDNATLVAA